jgi:hypothetical protein
MDTHGISIGLFSGDDGIAIGAAARKRLVYLDHNIWIDLAERNLAIAEQCRMAVRTGTVLFPVSTPAVTEVLEQTDSTQRCHVAALMDDLSVGVSFRPTSFIHVLEAGLPLTALLGGAVTGVSRDKLLCWVAECFARMKLEFPPSWNGTKAESFTNQLAQRPEVRSVRWLVENFPVDKMRPLQAEWEKHFVEGMRASLAEGVALVQDLPKDARWRRLLFEERYWAYREFVRPRIRQNLTAVVGEEKLLKAMAGMLRQVGLGSEERFIRLMALMPSLDLFCHIMAERRRDPTRKIYKQDFHDVEHAIVGGVYADVFVTSDRHLFDLLTERCKIPAACGCCVVRGMQGLEEALKPCD